jgi:enoyl-CoA hydratase
MTSGEPTVVTRVDGHVGRITLNRPAAINALTGEMVLEIAATLEAWRDDEAIKAVVFDGAGERGFCAGGDIVGLYDSAREGDARAETFWRDEYRLNAAIARYPKPIVAVMDGLVLGGGVGLACHASHRLVTERSRVGLPETGIGFFPDVGATWLLANAPGETGVLAALTNRMMSGPEAIDLGLADALIDSGDIPHLLEALAVEPPDAVIAKVAQPTTQSRYLDARSWIDDALAGDDLSAILTRLDQSDEADARDAAAVIRTKSPSASALTLAAIRSAAGSPDLETALETELRLAVHTLHTHDFVEGVRAQVIDKDRRPHWSPDSLDDVDDHVIAGFFEPLETPLFPEQKGA